MKSQKTIILVLMIAFLAIAVQAKMPIIELTLINQEPMPVKAGDLVEVRLQVQNIGEEEVKDWKIEAIPDFPFTLVAGQSAIQTIPSLPRSPQSASTKVISYKFLADKDVTKGTYTLVFEYYMKGSGGSVRREFPIEITSGGIAQISYQPTAISPGKETKLIFTISNQGKASLDNIAFSWSEEDGVILPVGSDNKKNILHLEVGETAELIYRVMASMNAEPDVYTLSLNMQYDAANQTQTYTTKAGIFVGGETDFDVTFSESSKGQTSLAISNIGTNRALSVTVRVPEQQGFTVSGSTDAILGNLDKGDYTIATFQIRPAGRPTTQQRAEQSTQTTQQRTPDARKNLTVIIDYTDTTGTRQTVSKTVPIQFTLVTADGTTSATGFPGRPQQTTSYTTYAYIAIALAAIIGLVYYAYKKWGAKQK